MTGRGRGDDVHILQIVHSMAVGGTERVVLGLTRHFNRAGFRTSVCCLDELGDFGRELQAEGVSVQVLGRRSGVDTGIVRRLRQLYKDTRVDLVHAHQYTPYFYSAIACLFTPPLKVVFTEHGRPHPDRLRPKRAFCNQFLRMATAGYTAVSEFTRESLIRFEKMPRSRIRTIYNGVDLARGADPADILRARLRLDFEADAKLILSVGRMDRIKDFATLLRAMPKIIACVPESILLIAGDGDVEYMAELRRLAAALGVEGHVRFLGQRSDVAELLTACDAFALTSLTEATAMTILEAMSAGRAVVATNVGGNPELVVAGETGFLVHVRDDTAVARALIHLLRDPGLARQMGAAARGRVVDRFDSAGAIEAYAHVYRHALTR